MDEVRVSGLKHQRRSAAMKHYAGLDVSVKETSVCVIDEVGKTIREIKGQPAETTRFVRKAVWSRLRSSGT